MALFSPPRIQDSQHGWGPCDAPEQFKDLPYAPFSKGDRLGKVNARDTGVLMAYGCSFVICRKQRNETND